MRRRHEDYYHSFGSKKLRKDPYRKKLGGVCAGIANYFDVAPLYVRIIAVIGLFTIGHATLIAYGIAYLVLDDEDEI